MKIIHGFYGNPEYKAWYDMNRRCYDLTCRDYERYGGRGITVCEQWRVGFLGVLGFLAFLSHIGERPSPKHSVDRINNERGYEPGNVRWATAKEQANNRRHPKPNFPNSLNRTKPWLALGMCRRTWYRKGKPNVAPQGH